MKNFRNLFGLVLGRVGSSSPSLLAGWQPASTTETDRTPSLPLPHLPAPVAPPPFRGAQTVFFRRNKGGGHTWVWIPIPNLQLATEWNPTDTRSIQRS